MAKKIKSADYNLYGSIPKTSVRIWSANEINWINSDIDYSQIQNILNDAKFENINPHVFLLYNKEGKLYNTAIWTPSKWELCGLFSNRQESLERLEKIAEGFLKHRSQFNNILTYPRAYEDIVAMCKRVLVAHPDSRYAQKGAKPESWCIIENVARS